MCTSNTCCGTGAKCKIIKSIVTGNAVVEPLPAIETLLKVVAETDRMPFAEKLTSCIAVGFPVIYPNALVVLFVNWKSYNETAPRLQ
ncbi:MAG: hypothetical protein IPL42_09520 [Saprospiraceae bacterium]|nr:hypothetical protein [Saprospiraceae bacterium]